MNTKLLVLLTILLVAISACTPEEQQAAQDAMEDSGEAMEDDSMEDSGEAMEDDSMEDSQDDAMMDDGDAMEEDSNDNLEGSGNALADFFMMKFGLSFMVEWDMTSTVNGQTTTSSMTQYMKGSDFRTDVAVEGIESRSYFVDDVFSSCVNVLGSWQCNTLEYQASAADDIESAYTSEGEAPDYDVKALPGRTVAGVSTTCFEISVEDATVEYCFSKEGIPLYIATTGGAATTVMQATDYSTTVADSVFELPV